MTPFIWLGIAFCITQSAMFSGLNLAFFSISKLRLQIEVTKKNKRALKILKMREDSNFLLTTILWGNVGINVLLTLLSNSVMTGLAAFIFSSFFITYLGEIIPQAYFSRHALKMASRLSLLLKFYQILLFPLAKPSAMVLDKWLGAEGIPYIKEKDLSELLQMHMNAAESDIERIEGRGAMNFLTFDDLPITSEGEPIAPESIIKLHFDGKAPVFPSLDASADNAFLKAINASNKKWIILTDQTGEPQLVLNSDGFLRDIFFRDHGGKHVKHCHRPIIFRDKNTLLGDAISHLKVHPENEGDDVVDEDIILFWGDKKRIITGADILGRLLRGIVKSPL